MKKRDGRKLSPSELSRLRNKVKKVYSSHGGNVAETARILGVSRFFVIKWTRKYLKQWEERRKWGHYSESIELNPKQRGRKTKVIYSYVPEEILNKAKTIIEDNAPNEMGINSLVWTERAVKKLFKQQYNIDMNRNAVYLFIHDLEFLPYVWQKYREIKEKLISSKGKYGYVIINGYIYFLYISEVGRYDCNRGEQVKRLVLKQRKKSTL